MQKCVDEGFWWLGTYWRKNKMADIMTISRLKMAESWKG